MNQVQTQGAKQIREAVVIAALAGLVNGLISWGLERAKEAAKDRREQKARSRPEVPPRVETGGRESAKRPDGSG